MTKRIPQTACPSCNIELDAAEGVTDPNAIPKPGDVTVCFYCSTVLEYTEDMQLTAIDLMSLQPEVQDVIAMAILQIQIMRDSRTLH